MISIHQANIKVVCFQGYIRITGNYSGEANNTADRKLQPEPGFQTDRQHGAVRHDRVPGFKHLLKELRMFLSFYQISIHPNKCCTCLL